MDRGDYWIPIIVCVSLVSPIAWVEYLDMFMEASMRYLAFPWFVYSPITGNVTPLIFHPQPFHPSVVWVGILWSVLGLLLIPILRSGFQRSLWGFTLLGGFLVFTLQNTIVMFGFFPTIDFVFVEILPIPTPALIAFIIIFEKYYRNRRSNV
ncbi:MAG: hypothetical protein ACFFF9_13765 [Candidatus Thorarchaeota archaeon]